MDIKILVDGTYNQIVYKLHRAKKCKVGDKLTVHHAYGQSLIDSGFAELWIPGESDELLKGMTEADLIATKSVPWRQKIGQMIAGRQLTPEEKELIADDLVVEEAVDVPATPAARKLAEESGIDISDVTPTGAEGKVIKRDVMQYTRFQGT